MTAPGKAELLGRSRVYSGRKIELWLDSVRLPNGSEAELEVIRHTGAAAIVPLTAAGEVLMIRQYRHATGDWLLEIPAGTLDGGTEDPEACARRELVEETGFRAGRLEPLGWIWTTPGFTDEKIWLYLATGLEPAEQSLEPEEALSVERVALETAVAYVHSGEIHDGKSICGLLRAVHRLRGDG